MNLTPTTDFNISRVYCRNVSPAIIKINTILLRRVFHLLVGVATPGAFRHKIYWINTISCLIFPTSSAPHPS